MVDSRVSTLSGLGGGVLGPNYVQMCMSQSKGHGSFLWLKVSEISEIDLKTGIKLAASLYVADNSRLLIVCNYV